MTKHQVDVLGLILSIAGAAIFAWSSAIMVMANRSYHGPSESQHRSEKMAHLIGATLMAVGFGLQLVYSLLR